MSNSEMTNILKNFASAGTGGTISDPVTGKTSVNAATQEKNAMKGLLEGLDSAQRSVKQMPATHKMAKATGTKHPASKFLVGGEDGEPEKGDEVVAEAPVEEDTIGKRSALGDIFKSLSEKEEAAKGNLEKEFHSGIQKEKELKKAENGKYELDEEDSGWGDELIEALKLLVQQAQRPEDVVAGVEDLIMQYESPSLGEANIGKTLKKGAKWVKRGFQGYDTEFSKPTDMVKRHQEYSDEELLGLKDASGKKETGSSHSASALQQKLINKNLRKRGKRDFEKYMSEAAETEPTAQQNAIIDRLTNAGGNVVGNYTNEAGETAILGTNGKRWFLIRPDGTHRTGSGEAPTEFKDPNATWTKVAQAAPAKAKQQTVNHQALANMINDAANTAVPDTDPADYLMQKNVFKRIEALGLDPMQEMDKAAKQYLGAAGYYDYLATVWDLAGGEENPWR